MTLGLPMDIFDFDISPLSTHREEQKKRDMGSCAFVTKK